MVGDQGKGGGRRRRRRRWRRKGGRVDKGRSGRGVSRETERTGRTVLICSGRSLVGLVVCVWMRGMRGEGRELRG
jgi:hypothetical protein